MNKFFLNFLQPCKFVFEKKIVNLAMLWNQSRVELFEITLQRKQETIKSTRK